MACLSVLHVYIYSYQCLVLKSVNNYISNTNIRFPRTSGSILNEYSPIENILVLPNTSKQTMIQLEAYKKRIDIINRLATPEEKIKWTEIENNWLKKNLKTGNRVASSTKKASVVERELQLQQKENMSRWKAIMTAAAVKAVAMAVVVRVVAAAAACSFPTLLLVCPAF